MRKILNPYVKVEDYNCFACSPHNENGLQMKFNFKNVELESGYENQDMYLVQYKDYNLINLPTEINLEDSIKVKEELKESDLQEIESQSPDE